MSVRNRWCVLLGGGLVAVTVVASAAERRVPPYEDGGRRDPMWSLVNASGAIVNYDRDFQITDMVLEGIIAGAGGENAAVINGNIVSINDQVGGYTVKEIHPTYILIEKGTESFILKLKKEE